MRESILLLLLVLDAFLVVGEKCFSSNGLRCENVDDKTGVLVRDRFVQKCMVEFKSILPRDSHDMFVNWSC